MIIQIYAFTNVKQALQAVELGVDHVGFVAGQYGVVHGELSFAAARELAAALPATARSSALTMATEVAEIVKMAEHVRPDIVHVSTDPLELPPEAMAELRRRLPAATALMKAIPVRNQASLQLASRFAPQVDFLLLDSQAPGFPGVGATGQPHDWELSRQIVGAVDIPVILAGGLAPDNVAEAIRTVQPWGVDSNTATNVAGDPVEKDLDRVAEFVGAVRQAEER